MCAITVKRGEETIAEGVVEFIYDQGILILRRLFEEEIRLEGVKALEWRERDDTLIVRN